MQGTLKSNNKVVPMYPYGCWNTERKPWVSHSQDKSVKWPDVFLKISCPHPKDQDERCEGCLK